MSQGSDDEPSVVAAIEPEFCSYRDGAVMLGGISERLIAEFVRSGRLRPVSVPGVRRKLLVVSELRELAKQWRDARDAEPPSLRVVNS